jgi:hypothetical protein
LGSIKISTSHLSVRLTNLHFLSVFSTKRLQLGLFCRASASCLFCASEFIIRNYYVARPKYRGCSQISVPSRILLLLPCKALEISCWILCLAYVLNGSQQSVLTFVKYVGCCQYTEYQNSSHLYTQMHIKWSLVFF